MYVCMHGIALGDTVHVTQSVWLYKAPSSLFPLPAWIPQVPPGGLDGHASHIRDAISVLFVFERRPPRDEQFTKDCRQWLNMLVTRGLIELLVHSTCEVNGAIKGSSNLIVLAEQNMCYSNASRHVHVL